MLAERGAIHNYDAYALGKMLDHSAWQRGEKIVRLVTASDIDFCFDNNGRILFCELSSEHSQWSQMKLGQRLLYENCIKGGAHCAVLCKHSVAPAQHRAIDTRNDIESFQVMIFDHGIVFSQVVPGHYWSRFVLGWFDDALKQRRKILSNSVSGAKP